MLQAALPFLIPAGIGALSGGLAAAGQGKNPLEVGTAALIGGGLGAGLGVGSRMAGQAIANMPWATQNAGQLYKAASGLPSWMTGMTQAATNPAVQAKLGQSAIRNLATQTIGGVGAAALPIGALAAGATGIPGAVIGGVAQGGAAAANALRNRPSGELDKTGNVPEVGQFGRYGGYGTPLDVLNPLEQIQGGLALQRQEADVQLENIKKYAPYLQKVSETSKKAEFERMMAAAGIRQNIATQAAMLQRSQQTAQQMGLGFAGQVGQALTSQYQYS